jgi:hypothetical protein
LKINASSRRSVISFSINNRGHIYRRCNNIGSGINNPGAIDRRSVSSIARSMVTVIAVIIGFVVRIAAVVRSRSACQGINSQSQKYAHYQKQSKNLQHDDFLSFWWSLLLISE